MTTNVFFLKYSKSTGLDFQAPFASISSFGVSAEFNATDTTDTIRTFQPGAVSKLCLSCHDGSVAVNTYGAFKDSNSSSKHDGDVRIIDAQEGRFGIGVRGDLRNHHPVGLEYAAVRAVNNEIADITMSVTSTKTIEDLLWNGRIECPTCHDVHNTQCEGEHFLWKSDRNSQRAT
ncbi:MAG: hypothetical protein ACOYW7_15260 [Nitrospirota bacterium]